MAKGVRPISLTLHRQCRFKSIGQRAALKKMVVLAGTEKLYTGQCVSHEFCVKFLLLTKWALHTKVAFWPKTFMASYAKGCSIKVVLIENLSSSWDSTELRICDKPFLKKGFVAESQEVAFFWWLTCCKRQNGMSSFLPNQRETSKQTGWFMHLELALQTLKFRLPDPESEERASGGIFEGVGEIFNGIAIRPLQPIRLTTDQNWLQKNVSLSLSLSLSLGIYSGRRVKKRCQNKQKFAPHRRDALLL